MTAAGRQIGLSAAKGVGLSQVAGTALDAIEVDRGAVVEIVGEPPVRHRHCSVLPHDCGVAILCAGQQEVHSPWLW